MVDHYTSTMAASPNSSISCSEKKHWWISNRKVNNKNHKNLIFFLTQFNVYANLWFLYD